MFYIKKYLPFERHGRGEKWRVWDDEKLKKKVDWRVVVRNQESLVGSYRRKSHQRIYFGFLLPPGVTMLIFNDSVSIVVSLPCLVTEVYRFLYSFSFVYRRFNFII